ncbi:MAG: DUF418 domain-containing protein [Crocinitomicaceae bacterium]|nr:DUF418 domain-containing protein [Crocinitomicaceae bacterium]
MDDTIQTYNPVIQQNRIELIDIFRGLAIFGIFMVNIHVMNCAFPNRGMQEAKFQEFIDTSTIEVLGLFFYGKFFPIFSFLFGLGISLQVRRQLEKGTFSIAFFTRRLIALFLFGAAHIIFIWSGDVLHLYAILGAILLLFIQKSAKFLFISFLVILFFPFYLDLFEWVIDTLGFDFMKPIEELSHTELTDTYRNGSYLEIMNLRFIEYQSATEILWLILAPTAFAMIFLGASIGKSGLLYRIPEFVAKTKYRVLIIFAAAVSYHYFALYLFSTFTEPPGRVLRYFILYPFIFADVVIALSIVWSVAYIYQSKIGKRILSPLRHVGQMAFTNYISQSLLGLIIFSSLGFGFYEKGSPSELVGIVILTYFVQIIFSKFWMQYFRFGPLEWLWRCISYLKIMPIKRSIQ